MVRSTSAAISAPPRRISWSSSSTASRTLARSSSSRLSAGWRLASARSIRCSARSARSNADRSPSSSILQFATQFADSPQALTRHGSPDKGRVSPARDPEADTIPADGASMQPTDRRLANAIRALAMDAVEAANSGHPGMPMGMADAATALFTRHLKFDASRPALARPRPLHPVGRPRLDADLRSCST